MHNILCLGEVGDALDIILLAGITVVKIEGVRWVGGFIAT